METIGRPAAADAPFRLAGRAGKTASRLAVRRERAVRGRRHRRAGFRILRDHAGTGCDLFAHRHRRPSQGCRRSIPAPTAFPLPYEDGFDSARPGGDAALFADQGGIFEIARRSDHPQATGCAQTVATRGIDWGRRTPEPYTMIGSTGWRNYEVACDVRIDKAGYAAVFG